MTNELLRAAMHDAGLDLDGLAELAGVDVRTVERWLGGRTPYTRHRANIVRALGRAPHELWPDAEPAPGVDPAPAPADTATGDELVAAYPDRGTPGVPHMLDWIARAEQRIDLVGLSLAGLIRDHDTVELIRERARAGCAIRILISAPDSLHLTLRNAELDAAVKLTDAPTQRWAIERTIGYLQPLLGEPRVEARRFVAAPGNSILRADDELLVGLHLYATPAQDEPILHLRRLGENGIFDRFAGHHDRIWQHASEVLIADPDRYPHPDVDPDRYHSLDPSRATPRYGPF